MPDLNVVAVLKAKPGAEQIVGDALRGLVQPTRAEEGCVSYDLYSSATAPGTFFTIEKWRSQSDLDGHMQTAHIQQALSIAGEHLAEAPDINPLLPV
ncbi:putative quinol monooxygenase [Subtercola boreus]|uniref:Antibiotic biosynthesis monooxygenase n=1 Tax=Subtercola boreus TaxID=120213 RepID=A0A3E0WBB6_9MICO|nr:putative quinol monooxygenase [Subtercola boreus]RFA21335.1 antibiotic biosynthesis monooxygenase [Subtercola boreus]RFA21718.1 antibiotic biosynthesis monooxygenase [Subtercola boreus]RFA27687.1 antibiotic biosynthesis monooxygenase [Subtercola boreus]